MAPHSLLQSWTEYKQSPEYQSHKQRSAHPSSPEYWQDEERWAKATTVHRLRHFRRQALRLENRIRQGYATEKEIQQNMCLLQYYRSEELDNDLREATAAHGFGHLRLGDGEFILSKVT